MPDVGVDRVPEEQEQHDGHRGHHREGEPVAAELQQLLPGDDERAKAHASARTMATNASSTVARVSRAVRTAMPRAPRTCARERHRIGAAAHGEAQDVPVVRDLLDARRFAQGVGGFGGALDLELGDPQAAALDDLLGRPDVEQRARGR